MKVEILTPQPANVLTTAAMNSGNIGVLSKGELFGGKHILKTWDEYVLLEDPSNTWDGEPNFQLTSVLAEGTVIKLTL